MLELTICWFMKKKKDTFSKYIIESHNRNETIADKVSARLNDYNPLIYKVSQCRKNILDSLNKFDRGLIQGKNILFFDKIFNVFFQDIETQTEIKSIYSLDLKSYEEGWSEKIETIVSESYCRWEQNKKGEWIKRYKWAGDKLFDFEYWYDKVLSIIYDKYQSFYYELHPIKKIVIKTYKLHWEAVSFGNGFLIYAPDIWEEGIKISPLKYYNKDLKESYNFLRDYLQTKLPDIRCTVRDGKLYLVDKLQLEKAILKIKANKDIWLHPIDTDEAKISISNVYPFSFKKSYDTAALLTPEFFKKYKSHYIDFLVNKQLENYRIVPVVERLEHNNSKTDEEAFIFTLNTSVEEELCIVLENVNPARATIIFCILRKGYKKTLHNIYDFICSTEVNKRSRLHSNFYILDYMGVLRYKCVNHDFNWNFCLAQI